MKIINLIWTVNWLLAPIISFTTISCGVAHNVKKKVIDRKPYINIGPSSEIQLSPEEYDESLNKIPLNELTPEYVKKEDEYLLNKYKDIYDINDAFIIPEYTSFEKDGYIRDKSKIIITIEGGPKFRKPTIYPEDENFVIEDLGIKKYIPDFNNLNKLQGWKKKGTLPSREVPSGWGMYYVSDETMPYPIPSAFIQPNEGYTLNRFISYHYTSKEMDETAKLTLAMLHRVIQKYKSLGKKVYLNAISYGAGVVYTYLSRYKQDFDTAVLSSAIFKTMDDVMNDEWFIPGKKTIVGVKDKNEISSWSEETFATANANNRRLQRSMSRNWNTQKFLKDNLKNIYILNGASDDLLTANYNAEILKSKYSDTVYDNYIFNHIFKKDGIHSYIFKGTDHDLNISLAGFERFHHIWKNGKDEEYVVMTQIFWDAIVRNEPVPDLSKLTTNKWIRKKQDW